jgi:hypothetical protein
MRPLAATDTAITDLYDTRRGTFVVNYPTWFLVTLGLTGVVAFAMSGFLGYDPVNSAASKADIFYKPWELYLWFCALLITLQVSIFRDKALRGRLIATLIFSAISIAIVYILGFPGGIIRKFLEHLLPGIASAGLTYTVINFGLIAIYFADSVWRWVRRTRNLPLNPEIDLTTGKVNNEKVDPKTQPSLAELIAGDLIAGAGLVALLALLFHPGVIGLFIHTTPPIGQCAVSVTLSNCAGATSSLSPSLTLVDNVQALIYFPIGALVLALTAVQSAFGVAEGSSTQEASPGATLITKTSASADRSAAAAPIAENVAGTVLDTLLAPLNRRIRLLLESLARSLRNIAWPALIFFATYGLYELSLNIQSYLHKGYLLSDFSLCPSFTSGGGLCGVALYVLPAFGWGLLSIVAVVVSAALTVFRWRVVDNTFRFLGLVGFIFLLTLWIFSLAMWGFNQLLLLTHASVYRPFDPPGAQTYISLIALLLFAVVFLLRQLRGAGPQARTAANTLAASAPQATQAPGGELYQAVDGSGGAQTNRVPVVEPSKLPDGSDATGAPDNR